VSHHHEPVHSPYRAQRIAFGTMHGKQRQVAEPFASVLAATVIAPDGLDTDEFGTFTGDVRRVKTPAEAARAKAELGAAALGVPTALGSEASYGDLAGVLVPVHEELLIFVDLDRGIEVIEGERTITRLPPPRRARNLAEAEAHLSGFGFPAQALVVRPAIGHEAHPAHPVHLYKGIADRAELAHAVHRAAAASEDGHALLEADLRAHHNPTRQVVLRRLGLRLALRLRTTCPACGSPGYGRTVTVPGLPCRACNRDTDLVRADVHGCPSCPHTHVETRPVTAAEPVFCNSCNP